MKISILTITAILSSFFFYSCTNTSTESVDENIETTEIVIEKEHHEGEHEAIVLNNGEKWKVVESMVVYIRNMEKAVNEFEGDDYAALVKTIDENIESLTSNCTMEGQAHDELHKWLVPFIDLSEQFDEAETSENRREIYQEFKNAFVEFNTYFE